VKMTPIFRRIPPPATKVEELVRNCQYFRYLGTSMADVWREGGDVKQSLDGSVLEQENQCEDPDPQSATEAKHPEKTPARIDTL
jgi:hypothetical protein